MAARELLTLDEATPQIIAPQAGDTAVLPITLNQATGDEVALTLNYTTNKATSGADTGFVINQTDTASPGTSLLQDWQVGGVSKVNISGANEGTITFGTNGSLYNDSTSDTYLSCGTNFNAVVIKGGNKYAVFSDMALALGQVEIRFASGQASEDSGDVGIKRNAAGALKVTDGSTGAGQLIFIVPTSDPGITGALWNNAGTLSISA